ncbi:MAG TPA: hypothetical protein VGM90_24455 [Kofleriaceae bacterium]|jgi:hypothetical protein
MRFTALIAALSLATATLGGCKFGVEHPAPFIGITAGLIAEGTCAIQVEGDQLKCLEISGTIGVGLGAIVALAMLLGGPGDTVLHAPDEQVPPEPLQEEPPDAPPTNPKAVKPVIAPPSPDAGSAAPAPMPAPDAGSAAPTSN